MHDTEDRFWWYKFGEREEMAFIALMNSYGVPARKNPDKYLDPSVPDLLVRERLADVKAQRTPFFTAFKYGMEPQFTVTFNRKDFEHYNDHCPDIWIYFWVRWDECDWQDLHCLSMDGVFEASLYSLRELLVKAPEHVYHRRQNDPRQKNAHSSFLLDVRTMSQIKGKPSTEIQLELSLKI